MPTYETIPVVEETARIDRREVETGRVKVHTVVETSEQLVREALSSRNVKVTRVPVDQPVTTVPEIRTENGVTIVPVLEEVLVVEKRLILKEEVHIEQEVSQETVELPVSLRKQRAVVERVDAQGRPVTEENE
jgi:stress response protein YsnF